MASLRRVCFYHAGCPDGFGAAWAIWRAWGDRASYLPRGHDDVIHARRYEGAQVVFADIATDNRTLAALCDAVEQLVVLDHHLSAQRRFESDAALAARLRSKGHVVRFDLSHSGAILAWEHFHGDLTPPDLLRYVEDQDLWRFTLPGSDAVCAAIASYPRTFESWDALVRRPIDDLAAEGEPILRANRVEIERTIRNAHPIRIGEHRLEAVNAVHLRSHIGHELALRATHGAPCGVVYRIVGSRVEASLYSIGEFDVARIAAELGGGGHRNAAGFSVPLTEWMSKYL
ncbi:hypothetical protein MYXO_03445 [Myxococcaceae bacterium]|jgi:hypothetical protein|nr:hypothetical protein MYXO_03445 [Myxococcaceae bacterium]